MQFSSPGGNDSSVRRLLTPFRPERRQGSIALREDMENVLIVGAGSGGQVLAWELRDNPQWKLWPRAFVDDDGGKIGRIIAGLPVIGSDSPGIGQVVKDTKVGEVADPADPASLAAAAKTILANPLPYRLATRTAAARYNWSGEKEKLLGVYNHLRGFLRLRDG